MPLLASGGRDRLIHVYDVNRFESDAMRFE